MSEGKSNVNNNENVLAEALRKFGEIQTKLAENQANQVTSTNERIDKLSDKMGQLIEIIARSEERHNTHDEKTERLETNQIELGKDFKDYRKANDERVTDVEKQVLLLEQSEKITEKEKETKNSLRNNIIGGVAVVLIIAALAVLFSNSQPRNQSTNKAPTSFLPSSFVRQVNQSTRYELSYTLDTFRRLY